MAEKEKTQKNEIANAQNLARVFIVDDHPYLREGVRMLINGQNDMMCCGEAGSVKAVFAQIESAQPDLMVVDISLPDGDGLDLIRDVNLRFKKIPAVVLSMHDETVYAEQALRAGASGYVVKGDSIEKLTEALRSVLKGGKFFSQKITSAMLDKYAEGSGHNNCPSSIESLSARELQVFEGIGAGLSPQQVAGKHGLSSKTVDTYRSRIKQKLGLSNSTALIHAAVRWLEKSASGGGAGDRG